MGTSDHRSQIGILNCLPPGLGGIRWNDTPVDAFIRFFETVHSPFDYVRYQVACGEIPTSSEACDAYVITGSTRGVYDADDWISMLSQFIRDSFLADKKLVGICFGHQILAHALGGYAAKSEKGWGIGLHSFDITREKSWMSGKPGRCSLYFAHGDQVLRLPPGAERLGGSKFCPNALFEIENRILGIQGHPEFTRDIMHDVLSFIEDEVEPEHYFKALQSLDNGEPDNRLVAQWIVNFLTSTIL